MRILFALCIVMLMAIAANSFAGTDRILEAKFITNGAATITLPTTTGTIKNAADLTSSDVGLGNVTNDAQVKKSEYTTKSGILIATGAGTYSELASAGAGDDGKVLMYDSAEATGVKLAAIPVTSPSISGTVAAPVAITAVGGVTFSGSAYHNIKFIEGDGGAIDITTSPQIAAGTAVGQRLTLIGEDATNTVKLEHGTGLSLNGAIILGLDSAIELMWDGSVWVELSRR